MKYLVLMIALSIAFFLQSWEQKMDDNNPPEKVKTVFSKQFPEAKKVEWEQVNEREWEAEFRMDGKEYSANFSTDGQWMETEFEIKKSDIPENIKTILAVNFKDYEIGKAEITETSSGKFYEFEIEQGEQEFEVIFDAQGNIIEKKQSEEDND